MLPLKDSSQVKRDLRAYLGHLLEDRDIKEFEILRQYDGCPYPSVVDRVTDLSTKHPVSVSILEESEDYYLLFKNS